jgi:hypothetical protein
MLRFRVTLAWLSTVSISMVSLLGGSSAALSQNHSSCTDVNDGAPWCAAIPWVSVERGKPFIAERVVKSWDQSFHENDLVARDATGRIYIEQHDLPWQFYSFSPHHDANTIWALGTASVFDCLGGKNIYLVPGSRTADIKQSCVNVPPFKQSNHPYSYALTLLLILKTAAGVSVQDLGNRRIEGFQALGIKIIWLGTDKDGDWKGRPIRVTETWRSDDLGATLLTVSSDFRKELETRSALINIRRVEPDASLFEVPSGYKISPAPHKMSLPSASSETAIQR